MAEKCFGSSQVAQAHLDVGGERMPKVVEAESGDIGLLIQRPSTTGKADWHDLA